MADTLAVVYRGSLSTTLSTTLYTVPASTIVVVRNVVITNTTTAALAATIRLNGIDILSAAPIGANGVLAMDLNQVLTAGQLLAGGGSGAGLNAHICGVAVS